MKSNEYMGNILRVNLSTGAMRTESAQPYADYIGGIGVGEKILYDEVKPWMSAYDPGNRLIICTGALSGTPCPGTGRIAAVTKSPLTTGIASGNSGGHFAPALRYAGYEYIVFEGRSPRPVYLYLENGRAQLLDACMLCGKRVWETDDYLTKTHGSNVSTMCIGPAGENLVRFACITVDRHRVIGKCGFGAVMGSKNLKAIAAQGDGAVPVADPEGFLTKLDDIYSRIDGNEDYAGFMAYGPISGVPGKYRVGGFSYRHGQDLNIPYSMVEHGYNAERIRAAYRVCMTSCAGCMVGCQPRYRFTDSAYQGLEMEGAPFNSVVNFGTKLGVENYPFCAQATHLCNDFGMDMDVAGELIGWVMECVEKGLLTPEQLDGMEPHFGDEASSLKLIEKIAYRDGAGAVLAEGVARASLALNPAASYYGIHMKGADQYEVMRPLIGYGLGVAVSTRGACHVLGSPLCESMSFKDPALAEAKFGVKTFNDPRAYEGKPEIVKYYEILHRACSSVGLCLFISDWEEIHLLDCGDIAELLRLVSGREIDAPRLSDAMLRLVYLERMFNYTHAGFTRKDDMPRPRLFEEAARSGPAKGVKLDLDRWNAMLDRYYRLHGCDAETGLPTEETLKKYGLEFAVPDLRRPAQAPGRAFRDD